MKRALRLTQITCMHKWSSAFEFCYHDTAEKNYAIHAVAEQQQKNFQIDNKLPKNVHIME